MSHLSAFHLDCSPIIPECGYECGRCLQEMRGVIEQIPGVSRFCTEGSGKDMRIVVEHDPSTVTAKQLMQALRQLPSFHEGSFLPSLLQG